MSSLIQSIIFRLKVAQLVSNFYLKVYNIRLYICKIKMISQLNFVIYVCFNISMNITYFFINIH